MRYEQGQQMGVSGPCRRNLQAVSQHWLRCGADTAVCGASFGNSHHPEVNSGVVSTWITAWIRVCAHVSMEMGCSCVEARLSVHQRDSEDFLFSLCGRLTLTHS